MKRKIGWTRHLTKKELKHIAETSADGRATLRSLVANINESPAECFECRMIASKLRDKGVKLETNERVAT